MVQLNRSCLLKFVLLIAIVVILANAVVVRRDYQDSWILEGLEISFVLFVAAYSLAFFSEVKIRSIVALAVTGRAIFLLLPNLKYVWFQGTAIDQHIQYGLANHVFNAGYTATQGPSNVSIYGNTPLIHIAFSIFSLVLNISVVDSIKYLPVLLSPIYPLSTYVIMKDLKFPQGSSALKYALFISSVPISPQGYIVTGSQFGGLLVFLILTGIVMVLRENGRRRWFIFIFLIFTLAATHTVSSVLLTTLLVVISLFDRIPFLKLKSYLKSTSVFALALICTTWLVFPARPTLQSIMRIFSGVPSGMTPVSEQVSPRLSEIARVDFFGAVRSVMVFNGADALFLLLTLAGLVVVLKMRKNVNATLQFVFIVSWLFLLLIPVGFLLKVGGFRVLHLASLFFPVFSGIFIMHISRRRVWIRTVIFSAIVLLATLQLYKCQPLIPSANVLSKDLSSSDPIVYTVAVNSIYQRQMIEFAEDHVDSRIACDKVTRNQIIGLTEFNFSLTHIVSYDLLSDNQSEKEYDCCLMHLPGASGMFNEQAEMRTRDLILGIICDSSVIYTNGESYILTNSTSH